MRISNSKFKLIGRITRRIQSFRSLMHSSKNCRCRYWGRSFHILMLGMSRRLKNSTSKAAPRSKVPRLAALKSQLPPAKISSLASETTRTQKRWAPIQAAQAKTFSFWEMYVWWHLLEKCRAPSILLGILRRSHRSRVSRLKAPRA